MKFSIKKAILSGLLSVSVLASSLVAALPVAAANPVALYIPPQNLLGLAVNDTFTVPVRIATALSGDPGVAGAQFNLSFDASKLECQTVSYSNSPKVFGDAQSNVTVTIANGRINNTAGTISNVTSTTGGDPAIAMDGVWLNIVFKAKATNTIVTLVPQPFNGKIAIDKLNNIIPTDINMNSINDGKITLGSPVYPDLTITGIASVTTGTSYDLAITVTNSGSLAAGASTATYAIDGGTAVNVAIDPLAVGASQVVNITGLTVSGQSDSIVVVADAAAVVEETNETNNSGSASVTVYADLVVSAMSTSVTPGPALFDLHFTVTNNGSYAAVASQATYKIGGAAAIPVSINALAVGASQTIDLIGLTATELSNLIIVKADSGFVITESNENNNEDDIIYAVAAQNAGTTGVSGSIIDTFSFVVPTEVNWNTTGNGYSLQPGIDPQMAVGANTAVRTMTVKTPKKWDVQIKANSAVAEVGGFAKMTMFDGNTTYTPAVHLDKTLNVSTTSEQSVNMKKTDQMLANGEAADLINQGAYQGGSITGYTRIAPVLFSQAVEYWDAALDTDHYYHMVVTFTCNVTEY